MLLNLSVYIPTDFIFPSMLSKYVDTSRNINRAGREMGIRRLMSINLLKRLESSVESFRLTVGRVKKLIDDTITDIDAYVSGGGSVINGRELSNDDVDFDDDDRNTDYYDVYLGGIEQMTSKALLRREATEYMTQLEVALLERQELLAWCRADAVFMITRGTWPTSAVDQWITFPSYAKHMRIGIRYDARDVAI